MQRKSIPSLLILLILLYSICDANIEYEKKLIDGINHTFNFQFEKAKRIFIDLSKQNDNDARSYVYLANIYVIQYLSDKREKDFSRFEYYSTKAIQTAESALKKKWNNKTALYSLASINGYRTLVFLLAKKYIDGVWAAKKCLGYTDDLLELDKNHSDAYLWKGLFDFALSQIPSSAKYVLKIAGIEGNFISGIRGLQRASSEGVLTNPEAKYFLSQIYSSFLNDNHSAEKYLVDLVQLFPKNILFKYSLASVKIKLGKMEDADELLDEVLQSNNYSFRNVFNLSYFLKGDCAYYRNQFDQAKPYYSKFIDQYSGEDFKPSAYLRLGISHELTNQKTNAKYFYRMVIDCKGETEDDLYSKKLARDYLNNDIPANQTQIILAKNYFQSKNYELMKNVLQSNSSFEMKNHLNYFLGRIDYELNDFNNAIKNFNKVRYTENSFDNWLAPYSKYYIALSQYVMNRKAEAMRILKSVEDHSDYDFEKQLETWMKSLAFLIDGGPI
ncbi:MAG: DUF3808 domain-containing protein [Ignavibacteria bacterium]|nr:DUF3808 domain-containing protein [Ignavibacteria bacterium]